MIGVGTVGRHDDFFDLGGDSELVLTLRRRVLEVFGADPGLRTIFANPTVARLTPLIGADQDKVDDGLGLLLPLRPDGPGAPLFLLPPGGGMSWCYAGLLPHVSAEHPLFGLQCRGLGNGGQPARRLTDLVTDWVDAIRSVQPTGPYHLAGWSFGGNAAHAVATSLQQQGEQIGMLALVDARLPGADDAGPAVPTRREIFIGLLENLGCDPERLASMPLRFDRVARLLRQQGSALGALDEHLLEAVVRIYASNHDLLHRHQPGTFDGDAVLVVDSPDAVGMRAAEWSPYIAGTITCHSLDLTHRTMMTPAGLARLGPILQGRLARVALP